MIRSALCRLAIAAAVCGGTTYGAWSGSESLWIILNAEGVRPGGVSVDRLERVIEAGSRSSNSSIVQEVCVKAVTLVLNGALSAEDGRRVALAVRASEGSTPGAERFASYLEEAVVLSRLPRKELVRFLRGVIVRGAWFERREAVANTTVAISAAYAVELAASAGLSELLPECEGFVNGTDVAQRGLAADVERLERVSLRLLQLKNQGATFAAGALTSSWTSRDVGNPALRLRLEWETAVFLAADPARIGKGEAKQLAATVGAGPRLVGERSSVRAALLERIGGDGKDEKGWRAVANAEESLSTVIPRR